MGLSMLMIVLGVVLAAVFVAFIFENNKGGFTAKFFLTLIAILLLLAVVVILGEPVMMYWDSLF